MAQTASWFRSNPGVVWAVIITLVGGLLNLGGIHYQVKDVTEFHTKNKEMPSKISAIEDWQKNHLAAHATRAQENEGRFSRLETKIQQFETIQYRIQMLEATVKENNTKTEEIKSEFSKASAAMGSRLARIETLLEQVLDAQGKRAGR